MTFAARWVRLLMVVSAAGLAGAAYAIRAVGDGPIDQYSGAALSAAIVYTIVLFIRPRISPLPAAGAAVAYCWFIEFAQLTPLPGEISQRSWFARQLLGAQFDLVDVAWYPVGVIPMVVAHWLLRNSASRRPNSPPAEA
ncbi:MULTISPECIES: ribosomal maturation YjgA family protein [Actinomadura]|uniref:ribosomal maturation YjgA family protein n=1 Tax=Actinomadura sp. NPDC000929 TaxID=3154517 RepID=UPI003396F3D7